MFYDVNMSLFPFACMHEVLAVWGWKRRNSAFSLCCQTLHCKPANAPCCRDGLPHPISRDSIKFLINDLECLLEAKQYYEY